MTMGEWKDKLVTEHVCAECDGSFYEDYDGLILRSCACCKNIILPNYSIQLAKWAGDKLRMDSGPWLLREMQREKQKAQAERALDIYLIDD